MVEQFRGKTAAWLSSRRGSPRTLGGVSECARFGIGATAKRLAPRTASDDDARVTTLTPAQFDLVTRELESMFADGDLDEAVRILRMFEAGRFNYRPVIFPKRFERRSQTGGRNAAMPVCWPTFANSRVRSSP